MSTTGGENSGGGDRPDGRSSAERALFWRLGAVAYRRRWLVVLGWVVVLAATLPLLPKLTERLSQGGFEVPGSQSDEVRRALEEDFGRSELTELLVVHSDALTAEDPAFRSAFEEARARLAGEPNVASIQDPFTGTIPAISPDGHTLTATIELSGDQNESLQRADEHLAIAEASSAEEVQVLITGAPPFYAEFSETTVEDLERAEIVAFPLSLVILLLAFGSLIAAGMPLILAGISLIITFGVLALIAATTTVSIFTQNLASMIGIGVGIDYSLFIVSRFREELRAGRPPAQAVPAALATSGRAVFVSGLTVVVALAGTQLVDIAAFRSMGWGAMIAVALAVAAALTLLPALLGALRERVNARLLPRVLRAVGLRRLGERAGRPRTGESRAWHRWAMTVMRRPWTALLLSVGVLLVLALPALHLQLGSSGPSILPADSQPRRAAAIVAEGFGEGQVAPVHIVVTDPAGVAAHGFSFVYDLSRRIATDPEVVPGGVHSIATLVPDASEDQVREFVNSPLGATAVRPFLADDGTSTLITVVTRHGSLSVETSEFVERIRAEIASSAPEGITSAVGGDPGLNLDINREVEGKLVPVVGMVLILSFLVLLVFLRSLLLPLKAVLVNTASVLAVYGLLVFVFQDGHFEGLLGFEASGHIESFLPLFLFCVLFGLSMDYEVFLLARIREEYGRTRDNAEAVGYGLERTAAIITSAAAVMIVVFGAFAFARLLPIKSMGFGLAAAVLIDATIIRVVLVPAAMRLMGRWNWWLPGWLDRVLPNVSLEAPEQPVREPVRTGT